MTSFRKYLAFARIGAVQAATERADLYGRSLFFTVVLGVFSALWRAVAESGMPLAAEQHQMVWYLAATEWILLSAPRPEQEIQDEVRRGDVVYQLPRPVSFPRAKLAECAGALAVRAPWLGLVAVLSGYAFTGRLPELRALLWLAPFGLLASLVLAELFVALGLVSFWIVDATPVYWVVNKSMFILGGLMLPLELYPRWLQTLAALTPFPVLLSGPGIFVIHAPTADAWWLLLRLLLWAALLLALVELMSWRALRAMTVSGG